MTSRQHLSQRQDSFLQVCTHINHSTLSKIDQGRRASCLHNLENCRPLPTYTTLHGLSHYLPHATQTQGQGAMIISTQPPTNDKQTEEHTQRRQEEDCCKGVPQYFSNSMSVLPADRNGGSYYVIYHRDVSGECRDDETILSSNDGNRRYCEAERDGTSECITTKQADKFIATNGSMYDTNTVSSSSRRRREQRYYSVSMLDVDVDQDDDSSGIASHTAEACVACSIPVLHFLQFFMC